MRHLIALVVGAILTQSGCHTARSSGPVGVEHHWAIPDTCSRRGDAYECFRVEDSYDLQDDTAVERLEQAGFWCSGAKCIGKIVHHGHEFDATAMVRPRTVTVSISTPRSGRVRGLVEDVSRDVRERIGDPSYVTPDRAPPQSGPVCKKGCRCGNSCISCQKKCEAGHTE
ncbi:hypothetical protein ACFL6C_10390 [Myxococcota bacterium]